MLAQELGQHAVDNLLADRVLQRVERERALLIANIVLVYHWCHRQRPLVGRALAPAQIGVQALLEECAHLVRTVAMLDHHQRRIFGKRFGQELGAFNGGADDLMAPPLMRGLVRGHVEDKVEG